MKLEIHFYHTEVIGHSHLCSQAGAGLGPREGRDKAKVLSAPRVTHLQINFSGLLKA